MEKYISIVIPNYNGSETIGKCLEAAFSSEYKNFEVIVVDDNSADNSVDIINKFPCNLIRLERHSGASKARNTGARHSKGDVIFFTDADCLLQNDTLSVINSTLLSLSNNRPPDKTGQSRVVIGGTYARIPYDKRFFSFFQSVFVNYFETKKIENPDYIAAHAMVIDPEIFKQNKGFPENFLPIIEDVELTHRLKREGYKLRMNPAIQVRHIFNFSLPGSMLNAERKTRYWTMYSLKNKDTFTDSGTASTELKVDVVSCFLCLFLLILWLILKKPLALYPLPLIFLFNFFVSRKFLKAFYETKGASFAIAAALYYSTLYALSVGLGALNGIVGYFSKNKNIYFIHEKVKINHRDTEAQRGIKVKRGK